MPDKVKILYDAVSKDYNVGSFEDFQTKLQDDTKRKAFYDAVSSEFELGDFNTFSSKVKKKDIFQVGSADGSKPLLSGSKPFQAQVDTKVPSVLTQKGATEYKEQRKVLSDQLKSAQKAFASAQGEDVVADIAQSQATKIPTIVETEREKEGNYGKYLYNQFLGGAGSLANAITDASFAVGKYLPINDPYVESGQLLKDYRKNDAKAVRNFLKDNIGATVDKGLERKYNEGFVSGAVGGLASSAPAILGAGLTGGGTLFAQMYDSGLQSIEAQPNSNLLDEDTKTIYAGTLGLIQAGLEKYGLDKILKGSGLTNAVFNKILKSSQGKKITGDVLENLIDENVKGVAKIFAKGGVRAVDGFATEFATGAGQETAAIASEMLLDKATGKPIFDTQNKGNWVGFIDRIVRAGGQEGIGGGLLGGGVGLVSSISKKAISENQSVINDVDRKLNDPNIQPEIAEVLLQRKSDAQSKIDDIIEEESNYQSNLEPDDLVKSQELSKQVDKIDLALQDPTIGEPLKKDLESNKEVIESEINQLLDKASKLPTESTTAQPTQEPTVDALKDVESTTKALDSNQNNLYKIPFEVEQSLPLSELNKIPKGETFQERLAPDYYNKLKEDIKENGIKEPVIIKYYVKDNALRVQEGHHRIKIANELGIKDIPIQINVVWKNSIKEGNEDIKGQEIYSPPNPIDTEGYRRRDYFPSNVKIEELGFKNKSKDISEAYHKAKADGSNPELVKAVENLLKPKEDAIQVETAGQVPVQPEARVGEKVEEGKPEPEDEVVTEKGKEVVDSNKEFAISEIKKGNINWDGDMFSPRPVLGLEWKDIRKGKADLLSGKDTPSAKRLIDAISKARDNGGYDFIAGSGSITTKFFVPIDEKFETDLTQEDLEIIAKNEKELADEYDNWFNNLSEEDKQKEIYLIENGSKKIETETKPKGKKDVSNKEISKAEQKELNEDNLETAIELLDDIENNRKKASRASSKRKAEIEKKIADDETELANISNEAKIIKSINDNFDNIKKQLKDKGLLKVNCK